MRDTRVETVKAGIQDPLVCLHFNCIGPILLPAVVYPQGSWTCETVQANLLPRLLAHSGSPTERLALSGLLPGSGSMPTT